MAEPITHVPAALQKFYERIPRTVVKGNCADCGYEMVLDFWGFPVCRNETCSYFADVDKEFDCD